MPNLYAVPASQVAVREYLMKAYEDVSEDLARKLVEKYASQIQQGVEFRSNAGWIADEIAQVENLVECEDVERWMEDDDDDND